LLDCTLNIVDVRLAALGLARIPEAGRPGRRYLLGGENLTLVSFLGMVAEVAGATLPSWRVPYTVALAYAHLSEWWSDHVSGKPPQANVTGVRLTRRTMHFDSSRSLAELGLVASPVREAVEAALAWLAGRGLLTRSIAPTDPEPSPSSA
jgi:dihydroflavonol-4-reductase